MAGVLPYLDKSCVDIFTWGSDVFLIITEYMYALESLHNGYLGDRGKCCQCRGMAVMGRQRCDMTPIQLLAFFPGVTKAYFRIHTSVHYV